MDVIHALGYMNHSGLPGGLQKYFLVNTIMLLTYQSLNSNVILQNV